MKKEIGMLLMLPSMVTELKDNIFYHRYNNYKVLWLRIHYFLQNQENDFSIFVMQCAVSAISISNLGDRWKL